jgi:hypothetical protein
MRGQGHAFPLSAEELPVPHAGVRSIPPRERNAHRLRERRPCTSGVGKTLQDRLPFRGIRELERDPAAEIDLLKRRKRLRALGPPRIGQVLLRRVRDGARPQKEGEPAQPDGRFQRCGESRREAQATGSNARTITAPCVHAIAIGVVLGRRVVEGRESSREGSAARRSWPRWSSTELLDHLVRP